MQGSLGTFISMVAYMLIVIAIGVYFAKRSQKSSENYFLGGRSLGPWVAAMSAEASDMSGWLLMGLPGVAYWCGLADATWTAIGLAAGTYINWLIISRRLRNYSVASGDAITVPDFFSNRFHEKSKVILFVAAMFIVIFFTAYMASCFSACGKLFAGLFNQNYHVMLIAGAAFVLLYTILGGFLAESVSDFMQAVVMVCALIAVLVFGTISAGGIDAVIENAREIPGYLSLTQIANPIVDENGLQVIEEGAAKFGEAGSYGWLTILSTLAWGLGYFGMPQVLLRFMAIRKSSELKSARRIATVWVVISLAAAVMIGVVGRAVFAGNLDMMQALGTKSSAENVFASLSDFLFWPVITGIVTAGILAAIISSSDSYLLIAASSVSKNIFQGIVKRDASDKQVMWVSRIVIVLITIIGIALAWSEESIIFKIVSFAWAGFGATFGPLMIFSLFWKRTNQAGAVAGMVAGGSMVFIWEFLIGKLGTFLLDAGMIAEATKAVLDSYLGIYELLPAFIFSSIVIVVVSLLTKKPSEEIQAEFDKVKAMK